MKRPIAVLIVSLLLLSLVYLFLRRPFVDDTNDSEIQSVAESSEVPAQRKPGIVNILCFGDSFTEGLVRTGDQILWHPYADHLQLPAATASSSRRSRRKRRSRFKSWHPYADHLQNLAAKDVPQLKVVVKQLGKSGEVVLDRMKNRFVTTLAEERSAGVLYDWIVIFGGINDLGLNTGPPDQIFQGIQEMHDKAHETGAKTLAVTIPELSLPVKEEERDTLNSLIGQYVKEHESTTLLLDLHKEMPYHSADPAFRDRVWCGDGLHPSAEGYDFLAEKVWQVLKPQLEGSLS